MDNDETDDVPRWEFPSASEEEGRKTFDEVVELMYCEHCKEDILTHLIANGHAVSQEGKR